MNIKIVYGLGVIFGALSYYFFPAFITAEVRKNKKEYPCLYGMLFDNEDRPISKKEYIGIVNYALIGFLVSFTPIINYILAILFFLSFNNTLFNGMLFILEEDLKENE